MGEERLLETEAPYQVGKPPARPDQEPGFQEWPWTPADLSRPDPATCKAEDTDAHAHGLIRVIDDDNKSKGEWDPDLDDETY